MTKVYNALSAQKKLWWETTLISTLHAPISGVVAIMCVCAGHPHDPTVTDADVEVCTPAAKGRE